MRRRFTALPIGSLPVNLRFETSMSCFRGPAIPQVSLELATRNPLRTHILCPMAACSIHAGW